MNCETLREGGCRCGRVRYRLNSPPLVLHAFGISLWVLPDDIEIRSGELHLRTTRGDSGAAKTGASCGHCGTRIYHASDDGQGSLSIEAGTLDDAAGLQPRVSVDRERRRVAEEPGDEESMRPWQAHHDLG